MSTYQMKWCTDDKKGGKTPFGNWKIRETLGKTGSRKTWTTSKKKGIKTLHISKATATNNVERLTWQGSVFREDPRLKSTRVLLFRNKASVYQMANSRLL
jgi:hypothetical protein